MHSEPVFESKHQVLECDRYGSSALEFPHSVDAAKQFSQCGPCSSCFETVVMCCKPLLSFLSILFLSMMTQKQIAASNNIQAKAATPDVTAVITVHVIMLNVFYQKLASCPGWVRGQLEAHFERGIFSLTNSKLLLTNILYSMYLTKLYKNLQSGLNPHCMYR